MKPNTTKPDMSWFEEGRFGLFMHWGLYALNGESEWLMYGSEMTPEEYRERFFDYFEPDLFDPKEWARLAKEAGMKYFVITAKHHDGFCLWDTKTTDFNAMKAPLCRRDLLKDIIEAFRAEGLKVGVYCTLPDWSRPDMPITDRHPLRNRPEERDCSTFAPFLREQVRELLTNYGKIDLLWFDGNYLETQHVWDAPGLNEMIRKMQPGILINRLPGFSDFHSPEWTIPKDGIRDEDGNLLPWEGCQVFNGGWCYPRYDRQHRKTAKQVVEMLIRHASRGGNLLLNAHGVLVVVSNGYSPETGKLLTRYAPLRRSPSTEPEGSVMLPLDLHVLSLPLAFILSQDQTLHCIIFYISSLIPTLIILPKELTLLDKLYFLGTCFLYSNQSFQ